jgi:hypothetical protein
MRDLVEIFERNRSRRRFDDRTAEEDEEERPWARIRQSERIFAEGQKEAERREWAGRRTGPAKGARQCRTQRRS